MRNALLAAAALFALTTGVAHAATVTDPTGDFLGSYTGSHDPDLDVTSFTVNYNPTVSDFMLSATLAGPIDPSKAGVYVIGVNTGTGTIRPFANIGEPNVIFNQAVVIQKTGAGMVGANPVTASINGDSFSVLIPLSLLPTTGFAPEKYGFNLWPRSGLVSNDQISDFSPQNATLAAVPEASTWALMIAGFGLMGGALRRRRHTLGAAALAA
jgi:hypothetical protein